MDLSKWMSDNGVDDDEMARRIKSDRSSVSRLRRGKQRPSWALIERLAEVTDGAVTANDFMAVASPLPAKRKRRRAA